MKEEVVREVIREFKVTESPELCNMYFEAFTTHKMLQSGFYVVGIETYENEGVHQMFKLRKAGRNLIKEK